MSITIDNAKHTAGDVFAVLADPTRRQIVEMLGERPRTASEIHRAFSIAAPAVSRHLRVLRQSGVIVEREVPEDRRVRLYALEPASLHGLSQWLDRLSGAWQLQLDSFKDYVAIRTPGPRSGS